MKDSLSRGAIGCAVACGAFVLGPMVVGIAASNADVLGVGGNGGGVDVLGVHVLGSGQTKSSGSAGAAARAHAVSNAPSTRSVVIRDSAPAAPPVAETQPAAPAPAVDVPAAPVISQPEDAVPAAPAAAVSDAVSDAPPAVVPDAPPAALAAPLPRVIPVGPAVRPPAPEAAQIPSTSAPRPGSPFGPAESSGPAKVPDSFRVGYAEYLRSASNTDLVLAAVPGVAGLAGFTIVGAFAGYRQAKAVQMALLAPVPTRVLL
jgi:hypothetical protein